MWGETMGEREKTRKGVGGGEHNPRGGGGGGGGGGGQTNLVSERHRCARPGDACGELASEYLKGWGFHKKDVSVSS